MKREGENARGESGNGRKGGRVKLSIISMIFDKSVQSFDEFVLLDLSNIKERNDFGCL